MRKKKIIVAPANRLMYVLLGAVGIGLYFLFFVQIAHAPIVAGQQKKDAVYPTQYSDTHITKNAKTVDPKFKDLAIFNKESFLASVVSSMQTNELAPETSQMEKGTWLWTPTLDLNPAYWNSLIADAKKHGINTIYLSIDSYLDIFVMPAGPEKEEKKKAFDDILENFIAAAHKNSIAVDAEAGWRNWAEPGNEYKASAVIEYVLAFNATHTEKLRGLQYDIEPYLLDLYATDKKTVLRNFIDLVDKTATRLGNSGLRFSVVIPYFYDGASKETPRFFYGWNYGYTLNHLLKVLRHQPNSTILVMAYRNQSEGKDGSIDISQEEVKVADAYHTKIIVAQETGEITPSYITFHNTSLDNLNTHIQNIQEAFEGYESYNGIAIHYINALMDLE